MKIQKVFVSLISLLLLASCNESNSSLNTTTNEQTSSSSSSVNVEMHDVKSALTYMKTNYNFQVNTQNLSATSDMDYYWAYYTSSYYVGRYNIDTSDYEGYIQFEDGLSRLSIDSEDNVYASELLSSNQDLYTNSLTRNLSNLNLDNIKDGNDIVVSNKSDVLSLLSVMGFNSSTYISLSSNRLNLNYDKYILTVTFSLNQAATVVDYEVLIDCFGETNFEQVDDFIQNGGTHYVISDTLSKIRTLFSNNNYVRNEYDDSGEIITSEYFTHQYYFNDISESYLTQYPTLASYYLGYVRIKKDSVKIGSYETLNYDDVYLYYVASRTEVQLVTRNNPDNEGYAQGAFTSKQNDITYVMNYPSRLMLWDYLEKFSFDGTKYSSEDYNVINDFISNFGITNSSETTLYANSLDIKYDLSNENDSSSVVDLILNCKDETGQEIVYDMKFTSFGSAYFDPIENFLDDYQLRLEDN